jgi:hypothetical protein
MRAHLLFIWVCLGRGVALLAGKPRHEPQATFEPRVRLLLSGPGWPRDADGAEAASRESPGPPWAVRSQDTTENECSKRGFNETVYTGTGTPVLMNSKQEGTFPRGE